MRRNNGTETDDLQYKRSFFVRMVSETKMYNPKIIGNPTSFIEPENIMEDGKDDNQ